MRDMRDAGGALGPVDGLNPELHNMTCSMTIVEPGDIIFITSDGVSDNFDPVVGKFCLIRDQLEVAYPPAPPLNSKNGHPPPKKSHSPQVSRRPKSGGASGARNKSGAHTDDESYLGPKPMDFNLPVVEAYQRHQLMLLRMEDLLRNGVTVGDPSAQTSRDLVQNLINFTTQLTM